MAAMISMPRSGRLGEAGLQPCPAQLFLDLGRQLDRSADRLILLSRSTLPVGERSCVTFQACSR